MQNQPPPFPDQFPTSAQMDRLLGQLQKSTSDVRTDLRREAQRVIYETDARNYLYDRLDPPVHIGARGTWACNFQILAYLTDHISGWAASSPTVLELGSGVSTAWLGLCIQKKGSGRLLSVEHDEHYALHTRSVLDEVGLGDVADVVLAPLGDTDPSTMELTGSAQWYSVGWLDALNGTIDILFVDGPPSTYGRGVRGAAYPVLRPHLSDGALVVLDDVHRPDEQHIIQMWQRHAGHTGSTLVEVATVGESAVLRHRSKSDETSADERTWEN